MLLKKRVFKIVEENGTKKYHADVQHNCNKYYTHLTADPKLHAKTKNEYLKIVQRYSRYLYDFYSSVYGEQFNDDGSPTTWYKLYR